MCQSYSRVRGIDTLSTVTRCTHNIDTDIFLINLDIYIFCLRHHRYCDRRGMDTSTGFGLRYTLYTVYPGFVFHLGISTFTIDHECYIFHSADTDLFTFYQFDFPSLAFCIMHIHTVDLCRKKCSLISACTGTDLNDNVLFIVRVLWKKKDLQFLFQFFYTFLVIIQLFFCKFTHLFIGLFL